MKSGGHAWGLAERHSGLWGYKARSLNEKRMAFPTASGCRGESGA